MKLRNRPPMYNKPSRNALERTNPNKRSKLQEDKDTQLAKTARIITLMAVIGTLYDNTDFFIQPDYETRTTDAIEEISEIVDSFGVDNKRKRELMEKIDSTIRMNQMIPEDFLLKVNELLRSMQQGNDNFKSLQQAIKDELGLDVK